ncbi:MAG: hypothetical protein GX205_03630 [Firmicutes bacterium]|jgi:uncharacterized protein YdcH (DUF465 family)|nr:hypothetical protein [Bacillota bacterium]
MSEALVSLYQNKLRLFKNLEILSRQFAAISITPQSENDGGLSRLQALLDERANLMDEIDALDEQIARHADGEQSEPEEVQEIKKELLALVEQIQKMSARLEKELERETGMLREAAHKEQAAQRSARAYEPKVDPGEGVFFDKRR